MSYYTLKKELIIYSASHLADVIWLLTQYFCPVSFQVITHFMEREAMTIQTITNTSEG